MIDCYEHVFESRLFDNHGLASRHATRSFLNRSDKIKPDLIHLHNIHGYFLNYKHLFSYIQKKGIPIVWTLHDCWTFTGHCSYFSLCGCYRWKTGCYSCPQKSSYPKSILWDRSKNNFLDKKESFLSVSNLTIVSVSKWLDSLVAQSFLSGFNHIVIHNGINTSLFAPAGDEIRNRLGVSPNNLLLLGVANIWSKRKGLRDFIRLSESLSNQDKIVLIGLTKKQISSLPHNIIGIERTESAQQLANYYSAADLFLNLTYEDNYPTTNLESISCGTPCLTYQTGGSPESITPETGFVVPQGDLNAVLQCIEMVKKNGKQFYTAKCRNYALSHFRQEDRFQEYIALYNKILSKTKNTENG
jgi:glycosyltransferase involved in cell wall biosynthesis